MNINDYRDALNEITPNNELKEHIMNMKTPQKRYISTRRVFAYALAAVMTLTCLFTVALAASPELRMAVLAFFHMEEKEQLPSPSTSVPPEEPNITQADIGQLVKAQYIEMNHHYGLSGDLLNDFIWSEDGRTLLDAKFWEVKDNELIPLEVELHTEQLDVNYGGVHYQGELYWYVRNGMLYPFKGSPQGADTQPEDQWSVRAFAGRTDALLLNVTQGWQMERTETSLLYHLDTGEAEELFAGVNPAVLEESDGSIWSPCASRALITGQASAEFPNGREWLYDREAGTLTDVKDLGGVGADMAIFVDDDTLILNVYTYNENFDQEAIACWVYNIPSGQAVQTLAQSPLYHKDKHPYGIVPFYGGICMEIGQDGSSCLIDLTTGVTTVLENFTFEEEMNFSLNPSGTKMLYYVIDRESESLGFSQLGAIDLEQMVFFAFDREGHENLQESGIVWEDNNTISIRAEAKDNETQYLLLYQF